MSELFDWTIRSWTGVFGEGPMMAEGNGGPIARRNAH
jgi:hypothetical protein